VYCVSFDTSNENVGLLSQFGKSFRQLDQSTSQFDGLLSQFDSPFRQFGNLGSQFDKSLGSLVD